LLLGTDGKIAIDKKRQAAEHALLGQSRFTANGLADPVRERLVVHHGRSIADPSR